MLDIGDFAPDFSLPAIASDGSDTTLSLGALRGQPVVLFFYPRDSTPTCTLEAESFSMGAADFAALGAHVVGISKDSLSAHRKFQTRKNLALTLASDAESDTCERYGAWGAKKLYGRAYEGILRNTYLIDSEGRIAAIWLSVKVAGHTEEVMAAIKNIENRP
ncbi:peroxiredoxin [Phaeovulum sp.]|uniref:peroxiredoxin n=1 Tax=Phaeovulum sp. TaxID=2934796 RepID=UPI0035699408